MFQVIFTTFSICLWEVKAVPKYFKHSFNVVLCVCILKIAGSDSFIQHKTIGNKKVQKVQTILEVAEAHEINVINVLGSAIYAVHGY